MRIHSHGVHFVLIHLLETSFSAENTFRFRANIASLSPLSAIEPSLQVRVESTRHLESNIIEQLS
jgi:hypothetical protein